MDEFWKKVLALWLAYSRYINLTALALGFTFDLWIAKRPDSIADNLLLITYLLICGTIIAVLNMQNLRRWMDREHPTDTLILLLVLQFCFGGLASNLLILYGKSGTLGGSVFFVGLLGAFALGNEFLKSRYDQLRFNVAIYYFLLLTYCVIAVPTFLLHSIGTGDFLLSCLVSVLAVGIFLSVLFFVAFKQREKRQMYEVTGVVVGILVVFTMLYFLNIIPPVPLSLKQIGIYHNLTKDAVTPGKIFTASYEAPAWYVFWRDTSGQFTFASEGDAYCFSAIFAPGDLSAPVVHQWEKYNTARGQWEVQSTYTFGISGGRAEGYRGYSTEGLSAGSWRCNVETRRGQLIGRISFTAVAGTSTALSTTEL